MPKGPKGQKRPADVVKNAVLVMRIATEEAEDSIPSARREGGIKGSAARAAVLTPEQRREIAATAAAARWKRKKS